MTYSNVATFIKDTVNKVTQNNSIVVNEYMIEQYVRFRDTLDKATQLVIGEYIKGYLGGKSIERFYSQFYEEYDEVGDQLTPKVQAFVATLFD